MRSCSRAFTLVEAMVVAALLVAAGALAVVALKYQHTNGITEHGSTQIRGIQQSMVIYAQGNNGYFPGLDSKGKDNDLCVEHRYQILLEANYFTGEYAISPMESKKMAWTTGPVTTANYSYAMVQIPKMGGRRVQWSPTLAPQAAVLSDRNLGTAASPKSIWSGKEKNQRDGWWPFTQHYPSHWVGQIAWNDNHVSFENTSILETAYAVDDKNRLQHNRHDQLFQSSGVNDALMIYSGN